MSIWVVMLMVVCNMLAYKGSKIIITLFSIQLGAPQVVIGVLVALYSLFPMILAIYATLGIFLILASRDPLAHRSLIWFTVWSSVVHRAVMAVQAFVYSQHIGHLWGDVLALFVVAGVLAFLIPRAGASVIQRAA